MGKIIEQSILDYDENNFSNNIPYPALITLLCIKGGVTFSETEKKSPKASHLTLIGVLKTPTEGEEVVRTRKRRITEEQPKETVLAVEAEREFENEERGDFEDYIEKLVLFTTTIEETTAPPVRTENRISREFKHKRAAVRNC